MDPLHITEFASERYFSKLRQLNENAETASSSGGLSAAATQQTWTEPNTFNLPLRNPRYTTNDTLKPSDQRKRSLGHDLTSLRTQRRPTFSGSFGSLRSKVAVNHKVPTSSVELHHQETISEQLVHQK